MGNLTIRAAAPADANTLSALIQRTIRTVNAADYSPEAIELICANFTPKKIAAKMGGRDVFAGLLDGTMVGTVSLERDKVHSLFVSPEFQRKGIGALLLAHIERHAALRGTGLLWLSSSITARPFYERLGYRLHELEPRPDGLTFLMSKPLIW